MKIIKLLLLTAILFTMTSSFAEESGACFILTMKYSEQYPNYTAKNTLYLNAVKRDSEPSTKAQYGSTYTPTSTYKAEMDVELAKLNKITGALKAANCYTAEDEALVKAKLK
jgi:hypothetical protein